MDSAMVDTVTALFLGIVRHDPAVRQIEKIQEAEFALIGGAAVIRHTTHRQTEDIDIAVRPSFLASRIKCALQVTRQDVFRTGAAQALELYMPGNDTWVRIDLMGTNMLPYPPSRMRPLLDQSTIIPMAAVLDLVSFKAFCIGVRPAPTQERCQRDAEDVWRLLATYQNDSHFDELTHCQANVLRLARDDLERSAKSHNWKQKLPC